MKELKRRVYESNLELVKRGVVIYTWGNVSAIDRDKNLVVIKPRGVEYDDLGDRKKIITPPCASFCLSSVLCQPAHSSAMHRFTRLEDRQTYDAIRDNYFLPNALSADDMSVVDLEGKQVEKSLLPSVDLDIHLALYKRYEKIGGIAHTHSTYASAWAQANRGIPVLGTMHADHFYGEIPCTRILTDEEVKGEYVYWWSRLTAMKSTPSSRQL